MNSESKGCAARLTEEQLKQLPAQLEQGAEAHRFRGDVWTTQRVARLIKKQFGVSYHPAHMSRLLKQIRYSVQHPDVNPSIMAEKSAIRWACTAFRLWTSSLRGMPAGKSV